jgi:hypothetical protein
MFVLMHLLGCVYMMEASSIVSTAMSICTPDEGTPRWHVHAVQHLALRVSAHKNIFGRKTKESETAGSSVSCTSASERTGECRTRIGLERRQKAQQAP